MCVICCMVSSCGIIQRFVMVSILGCFTVSIVARNVVCMVSVLGCVMVSAVAGETII